MIRVTRLDASELMVSSDMIEFIESTPDTILTLTDGKKIIVRENPDEILDRIIIFRRRVMAPMPSDSDSMEMEG
ncbi:MAG: flagellar FlbD family protein [Candidatus Electryonea clarkiae]|nr:flagellar FlbD family protein [Candidatus Electryonea clarkiae]MDP8287307.1 flagellar FlbD family protein [Candidatus Electryonea clarkiae]